MAAFCSTTSARVSWSIAAAPSRNRSISNPSSAMGSKQTALITEVRPPTQSCIGKRASQSFSSACRSSSLPMPVTATACRAKSTRAARYFASASTIPLRVSFVPPDFEMTITSVSSRASFNFPHTRSKPKDALDETLVIVISKSGGTKETRNGMVEAEAKYRAARVDFARHAVAVTGIGSELDRHAEENDWLARFPMHDWVGGRTSVMSAVGLLPMALLGFEIDRFLEGAAAMDQLTRADVVEQNAAMLLALMWFYAGEGRGAKDMVILPYKDRLALFSRYLQQLVMESLGKEKDREGKIVHQGIAVYGNKGSTDQHAYVQQLRDGVLNFFVTFIEVQKDRTAAPVKVENDFTSGDYLHGFLRGTRKALFENQRESITIGMPDVSAFSVGALIALYERAVGFYGSLVNINAYNQPGVEAGKKAATELLQLQAKVRENLNRNPRTAEEIARSLGADPESVYHLLVHLHANDPTVQSADEKEVAADKFFLA